MLTLLFFYYYLTQEKQLDDPFDPKLIDLVPVLVKISERLIISSDSYKNQAFTFRNWLNCGKA